jgi:hypothetical protein
MKPSWEWTEDDLTQLITDKVVEHLGLDYKASAKLQRGNDRKATEVSIDVSGFANSAGGTIVYGMLEDADKHFPHSRDRLGTVAGEERANCG